MDSDKFFLTNDQEFSSDNFDFINDDQGPGYVFALMNFEEVYKPENLDTVMHREDTASYFSYLKKLKVLKNIGAKVTEVKYIKESKDEMLGYEVQYTEGSVCDSKPELKYRTHASYVCDVDQDGYGSPIIEAEGECKFQITWYSKYACPMCNNQTDVDRIIGSCNQKTGTRSVTYKLKANAQCVILPGQPGADVDKNYITSELTHITE